MMNQSATGMSSAPASGGGGGKSFDRQRLLHLVDNDLELLSEIVDLFLEDAPGWLDTIREAVVRQDAPSLRAGAHALKGAVSNFAATTVWSIAVALEEQGRSGKLGESEETLSPLEDEMKLLAKDLRQLAPAR